MTFDAGQAVIDRYGRRYTVMFQDGCRVFVVELGTFSWLHPSNIRMV